MWFCSFFVSKSLLKLNMKTNHQYFRKFLLLNLCACIFAFVQSASAQVQITDATVVAETPAGAVSYFADFSTTNTTQVEYDYGVGSNAVLTSVSVGSQVFSLDNDFTQIDYVIVRVDGNGNNGGGAAIVGERCGLFMGELGGANYDYSAEFPGATEGNCDMVQLLREPIINRGANDVFKNGQSTAQNIERIDVLYDPFSIPTGATLTNIAFLATEKQGNSSYKVAAVTSIDAMGNPASYGGLVTIDAGSYGTIPDVDPTVAGNQTTIEWSFLIDQVDATSPTGFDGIPIRTGGNGGETIGVSLISLSNLGLNIGDTIFGVSYFDSNVTDITDGGAHDLLDPTTFPDAIGGGADIHGALGALVTSEAIVNGHVYEDTNGNGTQDPGEPDLANVDVVITDSFGMSQTVTTNAFGNYSVSVPAGNTSINIVNSDPDLPAGSLQTEGTDPTVVTAVVGSFVSAGNDGFAPVNDVPTAQDDSATTPEDTPIDIDVLADNGNGADD